MSRRHISEVREILESFLLDSIIYDINLGTCESCKKTRSRIKMHIISDFDVCYDCANRYLKAEESSCINYPYFDLDLP
jgi:hypothetical protein